MSKGYRQAPGKGGKKRTDGKRIAGKQDFGVPGSGGDQIHLAIYRTSIGFLLAKVDN